MSTSLNPEFNAYAEQYDTALQRGLSVSGETKDYFARGRINWLAQRLRELNLRPRSVLDFGCGTGISVPLLLGFEGVERLTGVDVSGNSLAIARTQHGSECACFSLIADHRPEGDIDLAFCNGVFHHIPPAERAGCVKYVFDCLRPGGLFALFENNPWNPGTRLVMSRIPFDRHAVTLSPPESGRLVASAGFKVLRTDFLFFFPRFLALLRRFEATFCSIPLGAQYLVLARKAA
jgi:SAM-dependent methyltransferase